MAEFDLQDPERLKQYADKEKQRIGTIKNPAQDSSPSMLDNALAFGGDLARSSRDQTNRIIDSAKEGGIVGGALQVGKEAISGINQIGKGYAENVISPQLQFGKELLFGAGKPAIADPTAQPDMTNPVSQPQTNAGVNAVIPPTDRPAPPNQTEFNDTNYDPNARSNIVTSAIPAASFQMPDGQGGAAIADPTAGGGGTFSNAQIQDLFNTANMEISNSLDLGRRGELIAQRDAAQKTLAAVLGTSKADKDRASDYTANQNAALVKQQQETASDLKSLNKESRAFADEDLDLLDVEISPDARFRLSTVSKSQANEFRNALKGKSAAELAQMKADGQFEGVFGLDSDTLFSVFKIPTQ